MLRILAISDIHASRKVSKLANVERDLTIAAGDLARCGSVEEAMSVLEELVSQSQPVIWIPGNCDDPKLAGMEGPRGSLNIHGKSATIEGLSFIGVGGSTPTPFNTPFELSDSDIALILEQAVREVANPSRLVLVSHSPPYRSGVDRVRGGEYVGSKSVREFIAKYRPFLVVTGHIHEAWGVTCVDGSIVVNPGPLAEGRYALILVEDDTGPVVRLRRLG